MRRAEHLFLTLALALAVPAGAAFAADDARVRAICAEAGQAGPMGERVARVASQLVGKPYAAGTLDAAGAGEPLVASLDGFDCVTLVETSLALARAGTAGVPTWDRFTGELESLRYRGGVRAGFASRLHYFSEWIRDNEARGHVRDITYALGGAPDLRPVRFMTAHRSSYKPLADEANFRAIARVEEALAQAPRYVLAKEALAGVEPLLMDGDVVAIATGIEGLDVVHTGLVVHAPDGRVHLLHAPEPGAKVQVSARPLADYMAGFKAHTGVMIARPLPPR